jgi:hypothetical protein
MAFTSLPGMSWRLGRDRVVPPKGVAEEADTVPVDSPADGDEVTVTSLPRQERRITVVEKKPGGVYPALSL